MVTRAGVIPTSIRDETGAIARHEAEANNRMAMLFHTLLAKREDRLFMAALRQQMAGEADARWYDHADYMNNMRTQNQSPGYTSPGAQPSTMGVQTPSAAAPSGTPVMPGGSPIPNSDRFSDAGTTAPNVSEDARNAFAQASPQQLQEAKAAAKLRPGNSDRAPTTQLPRVRNPRAPAPEAQYRNLTPEILAAWQDAERKNGLPPGQLLFTHGMETGGGRTLGNADGSGPQGPFQWTGALLKEKGLTVHDAQDYIKMGYATAKNMAENHAQLVKRTTTGGQAVQLTDSINDMPSWHVLHQWGRTGGPSIVAAAKLNPGMALVDLLPKNVRRRDGSTGDASEWLVMNGLHPGVTVQGAYDQIEKRGHPWRTAAVTGKGVLPDNGGMQTAPQLAPGQQPQAEGAPRGTVVQNVGPFRAIRTAGSHVNTERINPQVQSFMRQLQERFPNIDITSGYRSPQYNARVGGSRRSQHIQGTAFDADLSRLNPAEKGAVIDFARAHGANGIGNYGGNSIHIDFRRGGRVAWGPTRSSDSIGRTPEWFRSRAVAHLQGQPPPPRPPANVPDVQNAQAPQQAPTRTAQAPTDASAQTRVPVTKYPGAGTKPSEQRTDVTADFRGPTSRPWDGVTGTAVAAPAAPTTQQQPPPAPPQPMPPGIRPQGADMQAPPGWSPDAQTAQVPLPRPRTIPQGIDVAGPDELPMPPPRPNLEAQGAPSYDETGFAAFIPPAEPAVGAPSVDEAGMVLPPDARGAPSVDEAGMQLPPPINPADMGTGQDYAGAQSVDEAGMELHGQRRELPGTSIGNIRQPYTRADRRDMAARGEQPEPQWRPPGTVSPIAGARDWIADMVNRAKGGTDPNATPGDSGAQAMPGAPLPPISDMPMPPDVAGGDVGEDGGDVAAAPDLPPPAISDMPMPPQGDAGGPPPPPSALAAMKDAIFNSASMPQFDPQRAQENRQAVQNAVAPAMQAYRNVAPNVAAKVQEIAGAIFKKGTPSVTGKSQARVEPSPMAPGRPVKVERYNYNPDGTPRLDDGPPIQIPNPNQGRATTSTTPIPYGQPSGAPSAPATAPSGMPAPPAAGSGAGRGFKKWKLPDGRIVATKPGEAPPQGAVEIK